jgi:hypothetical protein
MEKYSGPLEKEASDRQNYKHSQSLAHNVFNIIDQFAKRKARKAIHRKRKTA